MTPKFSKTVSRIRSNRLEQTLKKLHKFEKTRAATFSKRLFSQMSPWNSQMCRYAGVPYPPSFEHFTDIPKERIVGAIRFQKNFVDF